MKSAVEFEVRDSVLWIALNRPEKRNAINDEILEGLKVAIRRADTDPTIGVVVLFGRGKAFSAGGDLTQFAMAETSGFAASIESFMELANDFRSCSKPIIAALHGHVLAGGFELAVNCDIRIAARETIFGLPDTPIGISPTSGMTHRLPRIVGLGRAMYLTLSGENIRADEAERIGLVSKVTDPEVLLYEAEKLAARISSFPQIGVKHSKLGLNNALDLSFRAATDAEQEAELACFDAPEVRENIRKFAERKMAKSN